MPGEASIRSWRWKVSPTPPTSKQPHVGADLQSSEQLHCHPWRRYTSHRPRWKKPLKNFFMLVNPVPGAVIFLFQFQTAIFDNLFDFLLLRSEENSWQDKYLSFMLFTSKGDIWLPSLTYKEVSHMETSLTSSSQVILQLSPIATSFGSNSFLSLWKPFELSKQVLFNNVPPYQSQEKKRGPLQHS